MAKLTGAKKRAFLRRMALGRKRKSSTSQAPKRRKSVKVKSKRTSSKSNMARRRKSTSRRSRTSRIRGALGNGGLLRNAMGGIGGSVLGGTIAGMAMPQMTPVAKLAGAYIGGGITGVVASVVIDGGLGAFGNMFGGQSQPVEMSV